MKHQASRALYAYWNERRGTRAAPERAEIEPGAIRTSLGDSFILAVDSDGGHPFRLAGTRVCALFSRELKSDPFVDLWEEEDRLDARCLVDIVSGESMPIVAGATGRTKEGYTLELELLILPLRHQGKTHARQIGILAPFNPPFWLGASPLLGLRLGMFRHLRARTERGFVPALAPSSPAGRSRRGLVVYDGGRS